MKVCLIGFESSDCAGGSSRAGCDSSGSAASGFKESSVSSDGVPGLRCPFHLQPL